MKIFFQLTEDQVQKRAKETLGHFLSAKEMKIVKEGFHEVCYDPLMELVDDAMGGIE